MVTHHAANAISGVAVDIEDTYGRLVWTFSYLCQRMPYPSISVVTLTSLAKVNRSRFYRLYQSKEGLIEAILDHDLRAAIDSGRVPQEVLATLLTGMHFRSALYREILREGGGKDQRAMARRFVENVLDSLAHSPINCEVRHRCLSAGLWGLFDGWLSVEKRDPDPDALSGWYMQQLPTGVGNEQYQARESSRSEAIVVEDVSSVVGSWQQVATPSG